MILVDNRWLGKHVRIMRALAKNVTLSIVKIKNKKSVYSRWLQEP